MRVSASVGTLNPAICCIASLSPCQGASASWATALACGPAAPAGAASTLTVSTESAAATAEAGLSVLTVFLAAAVGRLRGVAAIGLLVALQQSFEWLDLRQLF